jgi:hypothetical protein
MYSRVGSLCRSAIYVGLSLYHLGSLALVQNLFGHFNLLELQLQWHALRICPRHLFSWIIGDDGALLRVSGVPGMSVFIRMCIYMIPVAAQYHYYQYSQFYAAHLLHF